jgi:orotate phosphoribosyltransferase
MTDALAVWAKDLRPDEINRGRSSCALCRETLLKMMTEKEDYEKVLDRCVLNVKLGPFTASSGLELEYLLNATTSLLDKTVAFNVTRMTLDVLLHHFLRRHKGLKEVVEKRETVLVIGGEVGGGVMVAQCTALAPVAHSDVANCCDFAYMRKGKKKSGTLQQMEAPNHITSRTPESPRMLAVWLDEANSTGSELLKNVQLLKTEYNVQVVGAIFLVDRARDRTDLPLDRLRMAHPDLKDVEAIALYDLEDVDSGLHPLKREVIREVSLEHKHQDWYWDKVRRALSSGEITKT